MKTLIIESKQVKRDNDFLIKWFRDNWKIIFKGEEDRDGFVFDNNAVCEVTYNLNEGR
jgi:hypothetical protein